MSKGMGAWTEWLKRLILVLFHHNMGIKACLILLGVRSCPTYRQNPLIKIW
jgi:hypothetical protein